MKGISMPPPINKESPDVNQDSLLVSVGQTERIRTNDLIINDLREEYKGWPEDAIIRVGNGHCLLKPSAILSGRFNEEVPPGPSYAEIRARAAMRRIDLMRQNAEVPEIIMRDVEKIEKFLQSI